ncbi:MAG: hypothetical protein U0694_15170 [Anaerolineae bacterium]
MNSLPLLNLFPFTIDVNNAAHRRMGHLAFKIVNVDEGEPAES